MRAITAQDLMNPEVLTVRDDLAVRELAHYLLRHQISGAPVEDETGRLVGVVSVMDIAEAASGPLQGDPGARPDFLGAGEEARLADVTPIVPSLPRDLLVRDIMTPEVSWVGADAPVSEIAMTMLEEHLHRLLVLEDEKVVGIVSTSDLLGLLVEE